MAHLRIYPKGTGRWATQLVVRAPQGEGVVLGDVDVLSFNPSPTRKTRARSPFGPRRRAGQIAAWGSPYRFIADRGNRKRAAGSWDDGLAL